MAKKRVAVTGMGLITPLGLDLQSSWTGIIEGRSVAGPITHFDASKHVCRIAAQVSGFQAEKYLSTKEIRKMSLFIQYALAASHEALKDARITVPITTDLNPDRVGVYLCAGMGGLPDIEYWGRELEKKEKKVTTPFFVPMIIPNLSSGHLSMMINAQGPNLCQVTACSSSAHGIGESFRKIQYGEADIMICGGSEAVICESGVAGFSSMKALTTRNDDPKRASRPYDKDRDGFLMGEGAGVVVLEEWEHAERRGAQIHAEVLGYGCNADAYHITSPAPEGIGAEKCMRLALKDSGLSAHQIGYVNSHGTSTPTGDGLEAKAISRVFSEIKNTLHVSSTKSMTGHMLGAAGAAESIFCILAMKNGIIPPTVNLDQIDDECAATGLNFTPHKAVHKALDYALSNSFGFGGTNASLIFGRAGRPS